MEDNKKDKIVKKNHSGNPMSEESYKDWQKSFSDVEDSIKYCEAHSDNKTRRK